MALKVASTWRGELDDALETMSASKSYSFPAEIVQGGVSPNGKKDKTYGQQPDGVDSEFVCVGVTHLCGDDGRSREM